VTVVRPFVHALSLDDGSRKLIPTTAELLRAQSFLDGRSDFSAGPAYRAERPHTPDKPTPLPDRYIFHVGFCGSTLLSRLLDQPRRSLVLREPNCLADLANQANQTAANRAVSLADGLIELRSSLRSRWDEDELVVVKPSNWVNRLLPAFAAQATPMRVVFLTIDRAAFVRAIMRGGRDRLEFVARAALHFSNADATFPPLVADALGTHADGPGKLLALAATALELQRRLMRQAAEHWPDSLTTTLAELVADPLATARRAAAALDLALDEAVLEQDCRHWTKRHAKAPASAYAPEAEASAQARIETEFGSLIEGVLEWVATEFGD